MPLGDIYQLTISATLQGQRIENVFHYIVDADAIEARLALGLFNFANVTLIPGIVQVQSSALVWDTITVQKIWPTPPNLPHISTISIPGAEAIDSLPSEAAATVTKQTAFGGPRYRGRTFIAGIPVTYYDQITGLLGATYIANSAAFANCLNDQVPSVPVGGLLTPVLWHRADHTTTVIVGALPRTTLRSQRRREVGRGI